MYVPPNYYPSPAYQPMQQRLQMMESQYPQFANNPSMGYSQPNPQQVSTMPTILKGRPVSNEDEANAAMIDFDGSLFVFPDKAHGKIYTKQLGLDGNIIFLKYTLDSREAEPDKAQNGQINSTATPNMEGYVRKEDLAQKITEIHQRFNKIEQKLFSVNPENPKGGNKR